VHDTEAAINALKRRLDLLHVLGASQSQSVTAPE
jgi:hypothetical protein